ncbi:hypothetical protein [Pantoea vagans]|uniref:hypothetical protein n=1 Tax=Pantoea vagans TaxID=470934 RepID=UPI003FA3A2C0
MFSKVVIMGDVLRPFKTGAFYQSAAQKNIRWLHALLKRPIEKCDVKVSMLSWDEGLSNEDDFFDTPALYHLLDMPLTYHGWAKIISADSVPDALLDSLKNPLKHALVIGYEMPSVIISALKEMRTPYIDIVLHPLRFLPDLVFSFRTNVPDYHNRLAKYALDHSHIEQQVSLLQAKNAWMNKPANVTIPEGSAILLEQVSVDMALVQNDGRFSCLEDHVSRLHEIVSEHPCVFFKPHPYTLNSQSITFIRSLFPVVKICDANFYHLMMQPQIEKVVALNSSGLVEAEFFGKKSENLIPFKFCHFENFLPKEGNPGSLISLNDSWLQPYFWKYLFIGESVIPPCSHSVWQPDRLRHAMNADWGFRFISNTVV